MTTKRMRLVAAVLSAMVLSPLLATAVGPKLIITNLRGTLHVSQEVPCGGVVEATTSIADGRMEISASPLVADVAGPNTVFDLTRLEVFFTPFSVQHDCRGLRVNVAFREIGVRLTNSIEFTGQLVGDGQYSFVIPKRQFLVYESVVTNLPTGQPMSAYKRPSEDVTGVIDVRRGTAQLSVVLSLRLRFRIGCMGGRCVINELQEGRHTAEVTGRIHVPGTDTDSDGVPDLTDNCPLVANPTQSPVASPVLTAPRAITLDSCRTHDLALAEASDVCHARPVALTSNLPARFTKGRNVVRWRASDGIEPAVTAQTVVRVMDQTPPSLSCTAVPATTAAGLFQVSAADDCAGRTTVRLGSYVLADDERIRITQGTRPGVRLVGRVGGIRHFQVGPGDAVIVATDAAGNVASAACGAPPDITPGQ